jgi:hypothetical protein
LERELSLEDEQRLAVSGVRMRARRAPSRMGAHLARGELLDVDEKRDVELPTPQDDFAFDLDHLPPA